MSRWKRLLLEPLRIVVKLLDRLRLLMRSGLGWGARRPVTIAPYGGYCSPVRIYLQGRVLKDRFIISSVEDSRWRNLINAYKRFGSDEVPGATLEVEAGSNTYHLRADDEGYFRIDEPLTAPLTIPPSGWLPVTIRLLRTPSQDVRKTSETELRLPGSRCAYGVISDIDDTILKTDVTFPLKLMVIYNTILKNAAGRRAFQEVAAFYEALRQGPGRQHNNPFFYVSRSPWNLHDLLEDFLRLNRLPRGPLLLRDFGISARRDTQHPFGHKYERIVHILETYPAMPFVLIGDSGERDTDLYLQINKEFPGRVLAIYIRDVLSTRRARRIQQLLDQSDCRHALLIRRYGEAATDAAGRRLIDGALFQQLQTGHSGG